MIRPVRSGLILMAFAISAAACSQSEVQEQISTTTIAPVTTIAPTTTIPPTTTSTTTTVPATTTTTVYSPEVFDTVNGLAPDSDAVMDRRPVTIKIDNHAKARPQAGLVEADMVYEMLVEGGLTRFAAVYHQSDNDWVGPVRSGRVTDLGALRWMDGPLQVSGAQPWVQDILRNGGLRVFYDSGASTWRENHRTAPNNLYSSTYMVRDQADRVGWPDENPGNAFEFGIPTESDTPATEIRLDWSGSNTINWKWNGESYERYIGDRPHTWVTEETKTSDGEIITTPMLVVLTGPVHLNHDPTGWGSSIPTTETKNSGDAFVFTEGTVIEGSYQRDGYADKFHLFAEDGTPITLHPSKMWVLVFPANRSLTWE